MVERKREFDVEEIYVRKVRRNERRVDSKKTNVSETKFVVQVRREKGKNQSM